MEKYYIWLLLAFGESEPKTSELLKRFGTAEKAYNAFCKNVALVGPELTAKAASVSIEKAAKAYESILADGYGMITWESPNYPEHLRRLADPPCALFTLGDASLLRKKLITVVGARAITPQTSAAIPQIITQFGNEYAIVSSLSEGCDQLTCLNALHSGVSFIEILPCGLAQTYPTGSRTLRRFLLTNGGLLISEFLPKTKPNPGSFLRRSRIIGGISRVTLVLQAGEKSGSLATAEFSEAPLFLPPFDCTRSEYKGAINAMRDGAKPYLGHYSIEKAFARIETNERAAAENIQKQKFRKKPTKEKPAQPAETKKTTAPKKQVILNKPLIPLDSLEGERAVLYKLILGSAEPIGLEEIIAKTEIPPAKLSELLLDMEIDGVITAVGTRYVAAS